MVQEEPQHLEKMIYDFFSRRKFLSIIAVATGTVVSEVKFGLVSRLLKSAYNLAPYSATTNSPMSPLEVKIELNKNCEKFVEGNLGFFDAIVTGSEADNKEGGLKYSWKYDGGEAGLNSPIVPINFTNTEVNKGGFQEHELTLTVTDMYKRQGTASMKFKVFEEDYDLYEMETDNNPNFEMDYKFNRNLKVFGSETYKALVKKWIDVIKETPDSFTIAGLTAYDALTYFIDELHEGEESEGSEIGAPPGTYYLPIRLISAPSNLIHVTKHSVQHRDETFKDYEDRWVEYRVSLGEDMRSAMSLFGEHDAVKTQTEWRKIMYNIPDKRSDYEFVSAMKRYNKRFNYEKDTYLKWNLKVPSN